MKRLNMLMDDPTFAAGETRTATVTVTVRPAGLACTIELWLSPDGTGKSATSGLLNFNATGSQQSISMPVTMPEGGVEYLVLLDIYTDSILLVSYQGTETVLVPWVSTPVIEW